jgi:electron transfer flavoprotein alpha subunit
MATLRTNVFPLGKPMTRARPVVSAAVDPQARARVTKVTATAEQVELTEAQVIVSGGRGLRAPSISLVQELGEAMGAAVGPRGPWSTQDGWITRCRWARPARPCRRRSTLPAASAGHQHLAGMSSSKCIVPSTERRRADLQVADYGVVGDAFEVLPKLTEAAKRTSPRRAKCTGQGPPTFVRP